MTTPPEHLDEQDSQTQERNPLHQPLRSLTPISYLSSPVQDLASTLSTHALRTDHEDENVTEALQRSQRLDRDPSYNTINHTRDPRLRHYSDSSRRSGIREYNPDTTSQRERLQRYLTYQHRFSNSPASTARAYSNRTPSPNRRTLYDWAPSFEVRWNNMTENRRPMQDRSQQTDTQISEWQQDDLGNQRAMSMRDVDGDENDDEAEQWRSSPSRNTAWHDDGREHDAGEVGIPDPHRRANGANTQRILRYFMDRERSGLSEEEERARGTGWYRPHAIRARPDDTPRRAWYPSAWSSSRRHHDDTDRMNRILPPWTNSERFNSNTPATNCTSFYLENALRYLDGLRQCDSYEHAYETAVDCSLVERGEDELQSKMIMSIADIRVLQSSSWLQPGTIFDGHQYASTAAVPSSHTNIRDASRRFSSSASPLDHPPGSTSFISYGDARAAESPQPQRHRNSVGRDLTNDHWPVRVILHTVCTEEMLIQGTMEAYDVPQHSPHLPLPDSSSRKAGRKNAPIITFVEGHVIDFAKHSLLTPTTNSTAESRMKYGRDEYANTTLLTDHECGITFPYATPTIDAANWRKLPPFNQLKSDHAMAHVLLSKEAMEKLNDEWIFMRWKERCFVHGKDDPCTEQDRRSDHDRGHGLTISGFYYVSMSRLDGTIEGLYFDPNSTPYQHLRLKGAKWMWPALEMR